MKFHQECNELAISFEGSNIQLTNLFLSFFWSSSTNQQQQQQQQNVRAA